MSLNDCEVEIMDYKEIIAETASGISVADGLVKLARSTVDLFKGGNGETTDRELALKTRLLDLVDQAMASKEAYAKLRDAFTEIEKELSRMRSFEEERENYGLVETYTHSFAYRKRVASGQNEPSPYVCAPCFDGYRRVVLQLEQSLTGYDKLKCPICGTVVRVTNDRTRQAPTVRRVRRSSDWLY